MEIKTKLLIFFQWVTDELKNVALLSLNSLVGRGGYRASPGNILLIGITRSEKIRRKRFAMLTSQQNVPCIIFMHISAAITRGSDHNKIKLLLSVGMIKCVYDSFIGKLVPPLLRN